jgi:stage V sporulation protein G
MPQTLQGLFSDFRVRLTEKDMLRAVVSCKVGNAICLSGIRVVEGSRGWFISMPSHKDPKGGFQDIYFPANREVREQLQAAVLSKYQEALRSSGRQPRS